MAVKISRKQFLGLGGIAAGISFVFEQAIGWGIEKLLDMLNIENTSWLLEYWPQLVGLLLIVAGFAFLKWWPESTALDRQDGEMAGLNVAATQHSSFTDDTIVCLGFIVGSNSKKFDVKIRCRVSEFSGWQFYDEVEYEGKLEIGDPIQIYPVEIEQSNGAIKYETEVDGQRVLADDGLLYQLTVSSADWQKPYHWEFRVLSAFNGGGFIISQSERTEVRLMEGGLHE